jgi:hypothetical protein
MYLADRDADDCRLRWTNCRDPRLDQRPFTDEEDERLHRVVDEHGARGWEAIAVQVSQGEEEDQADRGRGGSRRTLNPKP